MVEADSDSDTVGRPSSSGIARVRLRGCATGAPDAVPETITVLSGASVRFPHRAHGHRPRARGLPRRDDQPVAGQPEVAGTGVRPGRGRDRHRHRRARPLVHRRRHHGRAPRLRDRGPREVQRHLGRHPRQGHRPRAAGHPEPEPGEAAGRVRRALRHAGEGRAAQGDGQIPRGRRPERGARSASRRGWPRRRSSRRSRSRSPTPRAARPRRCAPAPVPDAAPPRRRAV